MLVVEFFWKIILFFKKLLNISSSSKENKVKPNLQKQEEDIFDNYDINHIYEEPKYDEIKEKEEARKKADIVVETLKQGIIPENFHQRNLDLEVGGLETDKKAEQHIEDIWDERSEEVDIMGLQHASEQISGAIGTTGKRAMIDRLKKKRMNKDDEREEEMEIARHEQDKMANKIKQQRQDNNKGGRSI